MAAKARCGASVMSWANRFAGMSLSFNGRRQPSRGGTSRISREAYVQICERLGVKFPGPTRQFLSIGLLRLGEAVLQLHGRYKFADSRERRAVDAPLYAWAFFATTLTCRPAGLRIRSRQIAAR